MNVTKEKTIELKDKRTNIHIIWAEGYGYTKGISKCSPEDKYSSFLGGEIARYRAYKKLYGKIIKSIQKNKIFTKDIASHLEDLKRGYDNFDLLIEDLIKQHDLMHKKVQAYKERKAKGLPSQREILQQQVESLKELKRNCLKSEK